MELTTVQRQVVLALDAIGPCGLTPMLPRCPALDSKTQLKNVLEQLEIKGAVKLQSNSQYAVIKAWLKEAREHNWLSTPQTPAAPVHGSEVESKPAKIPVARMSFHESDIPVLAPQSKALEMTQERTADPVAEMMKELPEGVRIGLSRDGLNVSWSGFTLEPSVEELPATLSAILTLQQHIVSGNAGQAI
ncbi:hypothetical protein SAMN03080615_00862 [Amphritea atlantica]|uniref:Uncharacterized protein n=1 Tax=Amphritea atlantica TaxID=355243 RepID=A0A1H9EF51_9GAMM|nr:hypothetical protein [Amphritea atlantica]SEQ24212.1 hypothetical protein SAMN03080615_00862 [Amphritea atlantica]